MPQYQGIWTLAQAAQLQSTQQWATDPLFKNTTLLLQADNAANGAQNNTFLDSSSNNFTITRNGNTTQGTFTPYSLQPGAWGNYFDGTGDYLSIANTAALNLGTGDLTVEGWIYMNALPSANGAIASKFNAASPYTGWTLGVNSSGYPYIWFGTTYLITSSATVGIGVWHHLALVRSGSTVTLYVNGFSVGTATSSTNVDNTGTFTSGIEAGNANGINGYTSNVRVVKGTAVYTANFAPPTAPLTAITNTSLLTSQSNRFVDNSASPLTITINGTPSIQAFSPFAPQYQYTPSVTGGSGYFDGSGDYLTGNGVLVTTTTANTFSCEGWFYPTTFANLIWLVGDMSATGGTNNVAVDISTGGAVELYWWDGSSKRCTSTSVMRLNQWNYFAIVVNAGAISIYVNSTTAGQSGTTTLTNRSAASQNFSIGQFNNSTTPNGYIGSLRWSTSARTISSIPTAPYTSDADTRLLCNFTNAGIYDGTLKNDLETVGNAQVSTSVVKYGTGSMAFDGTGDWLQAPVASNQLLTLGTGDFTVECWFYRPSTSGRGDLLGTYSATPTGWGLGTTITTTADVVFYIGNTALASTSASVWSASTWTHVAVVRLNGNLRIYVNGVSQASVTNTTNLVVGSPLQVGAAGNSTQAYNGYIDDLRITKGIARYTANFTPPRVALPRQ